MSVEEKGAWIMGVVATIAYVVYLVVVLQRAGDGAVQDAPYVGPLLASLGAAIGAGIVLNILLNIVVAVREPRGSRLKDQRDLEIGRFGDHVGQAFVVIGGVGALALAMAEARHFWIANVIYLCFFLSAIVGSVARIAAYRRGLP